MRHRLLVRTSLLSFLALAACEGDIGLTYVENSDGCKYAEGTADAACAENWYPDADADGHGVGYSGCKQACEQPEGYASDSSDCDDEDPEVGLAPTWYADTDSDGHGDSATPTVACEAPAGAVADNTDCDDTRAGTYLGATEYCNDLDDDCDGTTDENDAVDASTWYGDVDEDGYGEPATATVGCDAPAGYIADASDCDDGDAAVHPGALEVCDPTDTDEDCNGLADDSDGSAASSGMTVYYPDSDGDGYGDMSSAGSPSCDPPTFAWSTDPADCDDADVSVNPAEAEVCEDGLDNDCDGSPNSCVPGMLHLGVADAQYTGEGEGDWAGYAVSTAGDVDGDGFGDVLVGAPYNDNVSSDAGVAYLVLGSASPSDLDLGVADASYTGEAAGDLAGVRVSTAGDVDGDGFGDLLVAAMGNDDGGSLAGAAYLILGSASPGALDLGAADAQYTGESAGDYAGYSLSTAGDVDGDGFGDLLVGAAYNDDGGSLAGAAYLILGSASPGDLDLGAAAAQYTGESAGDYAGYSVSTAGDVDGDGLGDILVAAVDNGDGGSYAGAAYLILGSASPGDVYLGAADAEYTGEAAGDNAGYAVSTVGDVNGDGFPDILMGAPGQTDGGSDAGAAYLILGSASPTDRSLAAADAQYTGEAADDRAGQSVSTAGDVDGDGFADILVGASYNNDGGAGAGAAYLILGSVSLYDLDLGAADAQFTGEAAGDGAGYSVSTAGDFDADGFGDIITAGAGNNGPGAAYLVLGTGW